MTTEFQPLFELVQTIGMWAVFLWLYLQERRRVSNVVDRHIEDLREISGLKHQLGRVQAVVDSIQRSQKPGETGPLPPNVAGD